MLACFECNPTAQIISLFISLFLLSLGIFWSVVTGYKLFHRKKKLYLTGHLTSILKSYLKRTKMLKT